MGVGIIGIGASVPFPRALADRIEKALGTDARILGMVELDEGSFNARRKQYDAEKLLSYLNGLWLSHWEEWGGCRAVLGVTSVDIFVEGMNFVFGLATLNGRSGVVSTARLDPIFYGEKRNDELVRERLVKEALHEFGHILGLHHCKNEQCVMSFSNSLAEVDRKGSAFCPECRKRLGR